MKARKPSDPLSWFYQAAIHGVTQQLIAEAAKTDPDVLKVDATKFWNQCPHKGENSANFLPWHRGYTFHFEQILRMHAGEDDFALPYWDYSLPDQREFPRAFGIEHLDGNAQNQDPQNINPLFHAERDYFLCGYEHPFTDQLPLTALTVRAVDASRVMASPVFFGGQEAEGVGGGIADNDPTTRGLLEQSPHDHVHRAVGGNVQGTDGQGNPSFAIGGMAVPPTAGFDPIFPVHHANIDRLWARWACLPGKAWGQLPDASWFGEKPWFFFSPDEKEVNRPRGDYFDHEALGVRFKDDDPNCKPLRLPAMQVAMAGARPGGVRLMSTNSVEIAGSIDAPTSRPTVVQLVSGAAAASPAWKGFDREARRFDARLETLRLTMRDVRIGGTGSSGFDVFLVPRGTSIASLLRDGPLYLGQVSLFNHVSAGGAIDQSFDLGPTLAAMGRRSLSGLDLVLVPYDLATPPKVPTPPAAPRAGRLLAGAVAITRSRGAPSQMVPHGQH